MDRMKRFIHEAHRRWLWQTFLIYIAFSAAAFVVSLQIAERRALPDWFATFAAILLVVGLPIVLITAAVCGLGIVAVYFLLKQTELV